MATALQSTETEAIDKDTLYVALTRPPMIFGVTDVYAVFFMVVEVCVFVGVGGGKGIIYTLVLAPALYSFGFLMCLIDPRIFDIYMVKLAKFSGADKLRSYWGGTSLDPS